jgi:D-amino-acid dehydrogenase
MKIAIVGAGIAGISTALELARDGHQVTVYEKKNAATEGASFAPGGWLSPCAAASLSTPGTGMPLQTLKGTDLLQASNLIGSATWRWMRQWRTRAKPTTTEPTPYAQALSHLEAYSQSLRWQTDDAPEVTAERRLGSLLILRTPAEVAFWQTHLPQLQAQGTPCQLLDAPQACTLEPGLSQGIAWTHAVHFPRGESINPRLWAQHLRTQTQALGVQWHTSTPVQRIHHHPVGVEVAGKLHPFDAIVICTGELHELLPNHPSLPLMPIWGYSVTAPVRDAQLAPRTAILDWQQQATISRLGQRVRITAGLEMGTTAAQPHHTPTLQRMYRLLNDWFPGGVHLSSPQVQVWRGARHHLPDGLPATGASHWPGIWLNLAHGSHGASLASGCARALTDMLSGRTPAIDMAPFSPQRF